MEKILKERKVKETRAIPPEIALPMIENGCWEENDTLQDIWIRLMANSMDPNFKAEIRFAFIEIIKSLTPLDARILDLLYT